MTEATTKPATGRPPRAGEPANCKLQVRCTAKEQARWNEAADRKGEVLSEVVRAFLDRWAAKP